MDAAKRLEILSLKQFKFEHVSVGQSLFVGKEIRVRARKGQLPPDFDENWYTD
jgi:hypothetical protein